jgi:hypothetical protein
LCGLFEVFANCNRSLRNLQEIAQLFTLSVSFSWLIQIKNVHRSVSTRSMGTICKCCLNLADWTFINPTQSQRKTKATGFSVCTRKFITCWNKAPQALVQNVRFKKLIDLKWQLALKRPRLETKEFQFTPRRIKDYLPAKKKSASLHFNGTLLELHLVKGELSDV